MAGPVMPWRPYGSFETNPDDAPVPTVYIDANRRRDAEGFASQLEELGPVRGAPLEAMEYARIDAASLLQRITGADRPLLDELQAAILNKDMGAFSAALESGKIGSRSLRADFEQAGKRGDKAAMADALRKMGLPPLNVMMARSGPKPQMAKEVGGPFDPVMGTERRCAIDCYITGKPIYPKSFDMRRPLTQDGPVTSMATIGLGYDAAAWEVDCLYHPYIYDGANAAADMQLEADGTGELDGRLLGTRPGGMKY